MNQPIQVVRHFPVPAIDLSERRGPVADMERSVADALRQDRMQLLVSLWLLAVGFGLGALYRELAEIVLLLWSGK